MGGAQLEIPSRAIDVVTLASLSHKESNPSRHLTIILPNYSRTGAVNSREDDQLVCYV